MEAQNIEVAQIWQILYKWSKVVARNYMSFSNLIVSITWNTNDPCFEWSQGLHLEGSNPKIEDK